MTTSASPPAGHSHAGASCSCLRHSLLHYVRQQGRDLGQRVGPFAAWSFQRESCGTWPYSRVLERAVGGIVDVSGPDGRSSYVNFGSQDYLGLAQDPRVHEAAVTAVREFGVHSAGSPAFIGRTRPLVELEASLAALLQKERCLLFPTGWAAGYGVVAGLVRQADVVVIDVLAHNCLQEGVARATANVVRFEHNDLGDLDRALEAASTTATSTGGGVFVVVESLYSMDSDAPDLPAFMRRARARGAIVIVDVAHDFGALGASGLGLLDSVIGTALAPDVVMGSFSKTFAANGGFVAASRDVIRYLQYYAPSVLFSNAMSPVQARVVGACLQIVFSPEGAELRQALLTRIIHARRAFLEQDCQVAGSPSPIVPVFVGAESVARLTAVGLRERGLLANLVEFPAVPLGKARFRFQMMANHDLEAIRGAAETFGQCVREARRRVEPGVPPVA